jgi:hypothetical protein
MAGNGTDSAWPLGSDQGIVPRRGTCLIQINSKKGNLLMSPEKVLYTVLSIT